jgi:hypothetical protein
MKLIRGMIVLGLAMSMLATTHAAVLPNDAVVDGKTIGEWTAEWWKWIYAASTNRSPLLDGDGSLAGQGQPPGSVFLVANIATPGTVTRTFTVEEGKYLFFPVRYVTLDNVDFPIPLSVEELRDTAAGVVGVMTNLHAAIDDQPIDVLEHRVPSPVFSFNFETGDNLDSLIYGHEVTGLVDPIVSDGYWIMVQPLAVGTHVITFGGEIGPPYNSSKQIRDTITVVPIRLSERVNGLIAAMNGAGLPQNRVQPLLGTLNAAVGSFDSGHLRAAMNQLQAFQNKVEAQLARSDQALAEELSEAAQQIIEKASDQLH